MLAAYVSSLQPQDPLAGLTVGERPEPQAPPGWTRVRVRAAALNHHDLFSLRGVGLPEDRLPMTLGCDAAGVTEDGREVVVHSVVGTPEWQGEPTLDPGRSLLSEVHQGTLAEWVVVPQRNLVEKPAELSFEQAACLPTAWLTAYKMLHVSAGVTPGATVLVQGAGGGVATAALQLGRASGYRMWATSRSPERRARAVEVGAEAAFEPGQRLPDRVEAVLETVGAATWSHSLRSLRPGGTLVLSGATTGDDVGRAGFAHIFFRQLRVVGSTMGNLEQLRRVVELVRVTGVRPLVDRVLPLAEAREGLAALAAGEVFGKVVLVP